MVFQTELKDPTNEITIIADEELFLKDDIIRQLISLLDNLSTNIESGLKQLSSSRTNLTANYSFETNDDRSWNQTLIFDQFPDSNPKQTFNITDQFRLTEFAPQRSVRDLIIQMYNNFGLVSIEIEISQ